MKSVGEAMAIGRTFKESLQKAMRSLEIGSAGFEPRADAAAEELEQRLRVPNADRLWYVGEAFRRGQTIEQVAEATMIDPWFLRHIAELIASEEALAGRGLDGLDAEALWALKRDGFSDVRLAALLGVQEDAVRARREQLGIRPVYKTVDTCGAEFEAYTPYLYSTYERGDDEAKPTDRRKIVILGGGPNRIGQGIEFDYCCVHSALALREDGFETIMVNCNPETVSTDYDTSDKLFFEPLTLEDVLAIVARERPEGVIVQFGGQTPLRLAVPLERAGVPIIGTTPDAIDRAEDRERFDQVLATLQLRRPDNGLARSEAEAVAIARRIGYPVLVRPSYVLGGRAMEIVYDEESLHRYMRVAVRASPEHPVLIDQFLEDAIEVDVDAVSDGGMVVIGGIMEHIERAGVHSGDSACSLPPYSIDAAVQADIRRQAMALARELGVVGLMNVQFAVKDRVVYVLEVNPRASRTVPFVSKAIGRPLAKIAARCMVGQTLDEQGFTRELHPTHVSVKEAVFPFIKFPGVDTVLGPEMKSTGEVMGIDGAFGAAFAKAQIAAGTELPVRGRAFVSVPLDSYDAVVPIAARLAGIGFGLVATRGTGLHLRAAGLACDLVNKVQEGSPHAVDLLRRGEIALVINTPSGAGSYRDSFPIRRAALECRVPYFTTIAAAAAAAQAIELLARGALEVKPLQEHHRSVAAEA
jgi:carbamoyl-phosphate synthase large subunit